MADRRTYTLLERLPGSRWITVLTTIVLSLLFARLAMAGHSLLTVLAVPFAGIAILVGCRFIARRLRHRSRELVRAHDGRLCLRCCHPLAGLGDDTLRCPECGHVQSGARARRHWRRLYDLDAMPPDARAIAKAANVRRDE